MWDHIGLLLVQFHPFSFDEEQPELIHKLCKECKKIEYSEFLHRVRLLFQCAMCGHVPLQRGYLLHPFSSVVFFNEEQPEVPEEKAESVSDQPLQEA